MHATRRELLKAAIPAAGALLIGETAIGDDVTRAELLGIIDGFDARVGELPASDEKSAIETKSAELRAAVNGLPSDEPHEHEWETVFIPGEGWKIKTHLGLIPDLSADATHTLEAGPFPTDLPPDARVLIPPGVRVTVNSPITTYIPSIAVQGELSFARDVATTLNVGTILLYPGGRYDQGDESNPITASSLVNFSGTIDTAFDPEQITIGFIAFGGHVDICGDFVQGTATTELTAPVTAGSSVIRVDAAERWKAGDQLQIADSRPSIDPSNYWSQRELRIITAVNGTEIRLDRPLSWTHNGTVDHLTRNVVWASTGSGSRAHAIYQGDTHPHICCASFLDMGRTTASLLDDLYRDATTFAVVRVGTNQRGRYAIHFHHLSNPCVARKCVVINQPAQRSKWAVSLHNSHGEIIGCVIINSWGAGIVGEAGTETGRFAGNSITRTIAGTDVPDYKRFTIKDQHGRIIDDRGFGGYATWCAGSFVEMDDNVANGRFSEVFSWDVEKGIRPTNIFTLQPIEGRPPELVGVPFDLELTPIRNVTGCRACVVSGAMFSLWGYEAGNNITSGNDLFQQSHFGGGLASLHCGHTNEFTLRDSRVWAADATKTTNGMYSMTDGQVRVTFHNLTATGWDRGLVNEKTNNLGEVVISGDGVETRTIKPYAGELVQP